jgi:hypothetical protein
VNQFIKKSLIGLVVFGLVLGYLNYPIQGVSAQQDELDIEEVIKGYDVFDGIGMDDIKEIKRDNLQSAREQNSEDISLDTATVRRLETSSGSSSINVSGTVQCVASAGTTANVDINGTNFCSITNGTIASAAWSFSATSGHSFILFLNCTGSTGSCSSIINLSGASCGGFASASLSASNGASDSDSCTVS